MAPELSIIQPGCGVVGAQGGKGDPPPTTVAVEVGDTTGVSLWRWPCLVAPGSGRWGRGLG